MPLEIGLKGAASVEVVPENMAAAASSGALPVFDTPCMIALMEQAALESVQPFLDEGQGTVGMRIEYGADVNTLSSSSITPGLCTPNHGPICRPFFGAEKSPLPIRFVADDARSRARPF